MIRPTTGFIVYGVHKDGLQDPLGQPFIDEAIVARSKQALRDQGVELVEHDTVLATQGGKPGGAEEDEGRRADRRPWCCFPARGFGRPTWRRRSAISP